MQSTSPFYAPYAQALLPPPVHHYPQPPPPPPSYLYQQYAAYPPAPYPPTYTSIIHNPPSQPYNPPTPTTPTPLYSPSTTVAAERDAFYRKLHAFRDAIGEPIQRLPTLGFKELDLWVLYKEVIKRHGIDAVIAKKQWKEVAEALQLPSSCTDSGFRLRLHYKKYLEAFERKYFKSPVEVELRERKPKKKSNGGPAHVCASASPIGTATASGSGSPSGNRIGGGGSESAETDVCGEEDSVVSTEKGMEGKEGRTQAVKRKKRLISNAKREKKKEMVEHDGDGGTETERQNEEQRKIKGDDEEGKETVKMDVVDAEDDISGNVDSTNREGDAETRGSKGNAEDREAQQEVKGGTESRRAGGDEDEKNEVEKMEREAARTLVAARSGGEMGSLGVLKGGVEKRRRGAGEHKVDFTVLDCATLKRYAQVHGGDKGKVLEGEKGALAEWVARHFRETPLLGGETATVLRFIKAVRRR